LDPLLELALVVKVAQRELERVTNEMMRPLGLTAQQADAVYVLGRAAPLSLRELGELLIAESGHPSRLVDRLVERGLVERAASDRDGRQVVLSLTPRGRELEGQVVRTRAQIVELGRVVVGEHDVSPVLELLRELIQNSPTAAVIERRRQLSD
jgi:MarR family transcriptional regulator, organic hydroperoxide resistance regulator